MLDVAALKEHIHTHPHAQSQDIIKFLYQGEFGCGHLIPAYGDAYERFCAEWEAAESHNESVFQRLNHDFCRVNLGAAKAAGMSRSLVLRMFFTSATVCGNKPNLATQLDYVLSLAENGEIDIDPIAFQKEISAYKLADMPLVSHSAIYSQHYAPSYRVVKTDFSLFAPVFAKIYELLLQKPDPVIVIDGMAASGKTTLAQLIATIVPCNIVQADSFFLPMDLRTDGRLEAPGGNIHHERLKSEVATQLPCTQDVYYGVFSCKTMDIVEQKRIVSGLPVIIEGSYSCHPLAEIKADLKIMIKTTKDKQLSRILMRNGKVMCQKFEHSWIPMENKYFAHFNIEQNADLVFET